MDLFLTCFWWSLTSFCRSGVFLFWRRGPVLRVLVLFRGTPLLPYRLWGSCSCAGVVLDGFWGVFHGGPVGARRGPGGALGGSKKRPKKGVPSPVSHYIYMDKSMQTRDTRDAPCFWTGFGPVWGPFWGHFWRLSGGGAVRCHQGAVRG